MTTIHDVTLTISPDLVTWPSDPKIQLERVSKIEDGANANVSRLALGVHTGTHVDAPFHFVPGARTVENLALETLVGPVDVIELPEDVALIDAEVLQKYVGKPQLPRILFKTRNSRYWAGGDMQFHTDFVAISADGAEYLVEHGVRLVGIDYLSISPWKKSRPVHEALLKAEVVIIEGLELSSIKPGRFMLYCLPLKLARTDGSPARVLLVED